MTADKNHRRSGNKIFGGLIKPYGWDSIALAAFSSTESCYYDID